MESYINLGKRSESVAVTNSPEKDNAVYYPSLYLNDVDLAGEVGSDDLGKEIVATVKLKCTRLTTTEDKSGGKRTSADFDIMGIKFGGDAADEGEEES